MGAIAGISRIGGHVALDFANTAGWHASPEGDEHLEGYEDVVEWAGLVGVLPPRVRAALKRRAARRPREAAQALARAIEWREVVYRIFARLAHGRTPDSEDVASLHAARLEALRQAAPEWREGRLTLRWPDDKVDLLRPVHPVMVAAAELLASGDLTRLRQCGNDPCGWLFLDRSRNGTRRWCSSQDCGNASRVRRFRARPR
jgi:predicted RNA-binding Zn ribbon-like protein